MGNSFIYGGLYSILSYLFVAEIRKNEYSRVVVSASIFLPCCRFLPLPVFYLQVSFLLQKSKPYSQICLGSLPCPLAIENNKSQTICIFVIIEIYKDCSAVLRRILFTSGFHMYLQSQRWRIHLMAQLPPLLFHVRISSHMQSNKYFYLDKIVETFEKKKELYGIQYLINENPCSSVVKCVRRV